MTMTKATAARCIQEQEDQHWASLQAMAYRKGSLLGRAAQEQREAAYHYDQAWLRLARLIGVE